MKKPVSMLLAVLMCVTLLVGCVSDNVSEFVFNLGYDDKTIAVSYDIDGTFAMPETPVRDGYAFRGWFTEAEGAGQRVLDATPRDGIENVYAYWTTTRAIVNDVKFGAFSPYPYNHLLDETDGLEIGYRGTEEAFRMMKDCGIDFALIDYYHDGHYQEDADRNLAWCEQYGLKAFISDGMVKNASLTKEQLDVYTAPYINSPAFTCFYIVDEPGELSEWGDITKNLRAVYPDKECHIDLCNLALKGPEENLKTYLNIFLAACDTGHIASDPYPFGDSLTDANVGHDFYIGLNLVARAAKKGGLPYYAYVQTIWGIGDSYKDLKFNLYADMSFGVSGLIFFCYDLTHSDGNLKEEASPYVMFSSAKDKTDAWYCAQRLIKEIHYFSDLYKNYTWSISGAYKPESGAPAVITEFSKYKENIITDLTCNGGLLVSEFEETNGTGAALMLLNSSVIPDNLTETPRFKIPGAVDVTMYMDETTTVLTPDADGYYTVNIPSAACAFITVEFY